MKTLRWIAPVTVLLGLATGAHAQDNGVVATFVGTPEDVFYDATATSDGGVVAVGYTTRVGAGGRDILLVKADPCGDLLWRKTLGGSADEEGRSVIELPGGDLAITGHTSSVGGPGDHLLISRLDASGHEIWTRVLTDPDGNPPLRGYDLVQDSNGDLIVTGTIWDSVLSIYSMLLAKFGSNGTFVAAAAYREYLLVNWDLWGESTIVDLDDNYIVVGGALHPRNGRWVLMARIRPNLLTVDWSRFLQEASGTDAVGHGAAATSDGKFILTGQSSGSLFISKREHTDPPVANWQKKISAGSAGHNIIQTSTSGFVVAGELGTRVLVGSWNADGSAQWIRGWGQGIGYGAAEDIENRLWVAGANGADALLAKLDPNGFSCYDMHTYTFDPVDWNPTEDVRDLGLHALLSLEVWPWTVDTANVSLQPNYDCDDECTEACCLADGTCLQLTPKDCLNHSPVGEPQSAGTACTVLRACCLPDGSCQMLDPLCCVDKGGTPQGIGSTCSPLGACCLPDGSCQMLDPLCCVGKGGTPQGVGSTCSPLGACCPGDTCVVTTPACCTRVAGFYVGNGTDCDPNPCPAGACCFDCIGGTTSPGCYITSDADCTAQGGRFQAGVQCAAMTPVCGDAIGACCFDTGGCTENLKCSECQTATIACCFPDDSCSDMTPIDCAQHAGTAKGAGTACTPTNPCCCAYCIGDLNCDGSVNFRDINPFVLYLSNLSNWQISYPTCNPKGGDINCDGTYPSFRDIDPFVALLSQWPPATCPHVCPEPGPAPRAQGPTWAGPNTTCADCCVVVPGTPTEGEATNCVTPDNYNGGCFETTPHFTAMNSLPATIYGQSGTFEAPDPNNPSVLVPYRDYDWYAYTSAIPSIFTMTVRAEFSPNLFVIHAGSDNICLKWWQTDAGTAGEPCTDVTLVTHCLPAGGYYFVVTPNTFSGVACGADCKLMVEAGNCELCSIACTTYDHLEQSPCNDDPNHVDENGGCNKDPNNPEDPNSFELFIPTIGAPYVVCGTTWANDGFRDLDWYRFTFTQRFRLRWDVESEVPIRAGLLYGCAYGDTNEDSTVPCGGVVPPTCSNYRHWQGTLYEPCLIGTWDHPETFYPPGTYWFFVAPEDARGPLHYGYPCGAGNPLHVYKITLTAQGL